MAGQLRDIPSTDKILSHPRVQQLCNIYSEMRVTDVVRQCLDSVRSEVLANQKLPAIERICDKVETSVTSRWKSWPVKVINGTGVILHTNLGRSPLSAEAIHSANEASSGYSDLELDLNTGNRGSRQSKISLLINDLIGSESAMVVNNNAAAMVLGLAAVASNKEVIIAKSESVEIGGGFRIRDVLLQSNAILREVGTTNRTYKTDFQSAISDETGAILSVHTSNFKIVGFVANPTISELVKVGRDNNVPVLHDIGSGCLIDTTKHNLDPEPRPQDSINSGVDLCFFSGDKLLGGPQCGIIAGKKKYIDMLNVHPLARAFRIDKASLSALQTTLIHYIKNEALQKIPTWMMISESNKTLRSRAERIASQVNGSSLTIVDTQSTIGGGSLPGQTLPSTAICIDSKSPDSLAKALRQSNNPVMARIENDQVFIDLRTVLPEEDNTLSQILLETIRT